MKHRGEETEVLSADERHFDIGPLSGGPIQVSCGLHAREPATQNEDPGFVRAEGCDTFALTFALTDETTAVQILGRRMSAAVLLIEALGRLERRHPALGRRGNGAVEAQ